MHFCEDCKYGEHKECFRFDKETNIDITKHKMIREKHAAIHNKNHDCFYYETEPFTKKVMDFSKEVSYSIIKLLKIKRVT